MHVCTRTYIHHPAMAAQMKYRWPEMHLLLSICGKLKQTLHHIFPMQPYFVVGSAPFLLAVICSKVPVINLIPLRWCARILGTSEHDAICKLRSQSSLFGAIKWPSTDCLSGKWTARHAVKFSSLPVVFFFIPYSPRNLEFFCNMNNTMHPILSLFQCRHFGCKTVWPSVFPCCLCMWLPQCNLHLPTDK